jgi:hypothetical protein
MVVSLVDAAARFEFEGSTPCPAEEGITAEVTEATEED